MSVAIGSDVATIVNDLVDEVTKILNDEDLTKPSLVFASVHPERSASRLHSRPKKIKHGMSGRHLFTPTPSKSNVPPILPRSACVGKLRIESHHHFQKSFSFKTSSNKGESSKCQNISNSNDSQTIPQQRLQNNESNKKCSISDSVDTVVARMSSAKSDDLPSRVVGGKYKKKSSFSKSMTEDSTLLGNKSTSTNDTNNVSPGIVVSSSSNIVLPNTLFLGSNGNIIPVGNGHYYIKASGHMPQNGGQIIPMLHPPTLVSINPQSVNRSDNSESQQIMRTPIPSNENKHKFIQPRPKPTTGTVSSPSRNVKIMNGSSHHVPPLLSEISTICKSAEETQHGHDVIIDKEQPNSNNYRIKKHLIKNYDSPPILSENWHSILCSDESKREDEEENEPPPVLIRDELCSNHGGNVFLMQANLMRDQIFAPENCVSVKHSLGGEIIEENSEPFPCENNHIYASQKRQVSINHESSNLSNNTQSRKSKRKNKRGRMISCSSEDESNSTDERRITESKKGRRREVEGLLSMDFGKNTPFQTTSIDEYTKKVMMGQQQRSTGCAAVRQSSESSHSTTIASKIKNGRERLKRQQFSPQFPNRPSSRSTRSESRELFDVLHKTKLSRGRLDQTVYQKISPNVEKEVCLGCKKSFTENGPRDTHNPQYCSKECRKRYKRMKEEKPKDASGVARNFEQSCSELGYSREYAKSKSPLYGSQKRKPIKTIHASGVGNSTLSTSSNSVADLSSHNDVRNLPSALTLQQSPPMVAPIPLPSQSHQQPSVASSYLNNSSFFNTFNQIRPLNQPTMIPYDANTFQGRNQIFSSQSAFVQPPTSSYVSSVNSTVGPTASAERNAALESLTTKGVRSWTSQDVAQWVNIITGSENNGECFIQQEIDGDSLLLLNSDQLQNELKFKLGPLVKLNNALVNLKNSLGLS